MAEQDQPQRRSGPTEDWNPDYFPTSARPIFRAILILSAILIALCVFVYATSETDTEAALEKESKKEQVQSDLLADEQFEDEE